MNRGVIEKSFWQLLLVYGVIVFLIGFGFLFKYTFHFEIFALILGIIGIFVLKVRKRKDKGLVKERLKFPLIVIGILLIIGLRFYSQVLIEVPIGYDYGIYKYSIESFSEKGFGVDSWVKGSMTPGFLYLMYLLDLVFDVGFLLKGLYVLLFGVLGISVYFLGKEQFGERAGLISLGLFAFSIVQFKFFSFMYYKNLLALIFLVWAVYFYSKKNYRIFVLFGFLVGIFHRPTFFVFGLGYILNLIWNRKEIKKNFILGLGTVFLVGLGYIGFWGEAILPLLGPLYEGFVEPGVAGGTFITFMTYQFSTLGYLLFGIIGFGLVAKSKKLNLMWFIGLVLVIIVYFQFFFFNRFIIHLDLFLILFAGFGFSEILSRKKYLGLLLLGIVILSGIIGVYNESHNLSGLIHPDHLDLIERIDDVTESGDYVIANSGESAPWVLGFSNRETIAPGIFGANLWDRSEWERFWTTSSFVETKELMSVYGEGEFYLFSETEGFNNPCFEEFLTNDGGYAWFKYRCYDNVTR